MTRCYDDYDEGGIVRCECGRAVPCRHCPTTPPQIDPADIRPGDVVERRERGTVMERDDYMGYFLIQGDDDQEWRLTQGRGTWHLVSTDPDAEARACAWAEYRKDYAPNTKAEAAAHKAFVAGWQASRESVRRAES